MTCKPESAKQRLERIAVQIFAAYKSNPCPQICNATAEEMAAAAIYQAQELIKQLDALPLDE